MTVRMRSSGRSSAARRSSSSGSPKCMKRPPLQVPIAVRVGSSIRPGWYELAMDRRLGVLAFGDSITNGGGELQWGVALQSWALWTARGLGLPYTGWAVDGATAAHVASEQIPAFRARFAQPDARFDLGCLYIGVNDVRALDWDARAYERDLRAALGFLCERCDRVLACTIPLDLGRPRAGGGGEHGDRARRARSRRARARPARLRRAQPRDGGRGPADSARPGGDRRARARRARRRRDDGARAPERADRVRDDALEAAARRRDVRLPAGQAGAAPGGCGSRAGCTQVRARVNGAHRGRCAIAAGARERRSATASGSATGVDGG